MIIYSESSEFVASKMFCCRQISVKVTGLLDLAVIEISSFTWAQQAVSLPTLPCGSEWDQFP